VSEVIPGVYGFRNPSDPFRGVQGPNVYLIASGPGLLIDSGYPDEAHTAWLLEQLKEAGWTKLGAILLTHDHVDHAGGAEAGNNRSSRNLPFEEETATSPTARSRTRRCLNGMACP
jgi:glyoxylase-like metal-dependent hydrolase (beta-lactamase superfamily II)